MLANYNDMEGLIDKIILIDEFTSKFSDNNIVIAIKLANESAANDCRGILEKHYFDILRDIEVDKDTSKKYTLLFVELDRNATFVDNVMAIMHTLTALCGNEKWLFKVTSDKHSKRLPLTRENLRHYVIFNHHVEQAIETNKQKYVFDEIESEIRNECLDKKNSALINEGVSYYIKGIVNNDDVKVINESVIETNMSDILRINDCFKKSMIDNIYQRENSFCVDLGSKTIILEK